MCDQQSLRSACPYALTDQSLCWSLKYSLIVKLLTEPRLRFLSLKGGCTVLSESTLVKMPHFWKSCVTTYFCISVPKLCSGSYYGFGVIPQKKDCHGQSLWISSKTNGKYHDMKKAHLMANQPIYSKRIAQVLKHMTFISHGKASYYTVL